MRNFCWINTLLTIWCIIAVMSWGIFHGSHAYTTEHPGTQVTCSNVALDPMTSIHTSAWRSGQHGFWLGRRRKSHKTLSKLLRFIVVSLENWRFLDKTRSFQCFVAYNLDSKHQHVIKPFTIYRCINRNQTIAFSPLIPTFGMGWDGMGIPVAFACTQHLKLGPWR